MEKQQILSAIITLHNPAKVLEIFQLSGSISRGAIPSHTFLTFRPIERRNKGIFVK